MDKINYKTELNKLSKIFIYAFVLNWIWENTHAVLYYHPDGSVMTQWLLIQATLLDALFITGMGILFLSVTYFRKRLWYSIIFGIIVAVVIEWQALSAGYWAYTEAMPIVPILNTGLTPTIQLGLLSYLIYILVGIKKTEN